MPEKPIDQDEVKTPGGEDLSPGDEGAGGIGEEPGVSGTNARIEELERDLAQLKDQLLRKAAEFENYKKRTESELVSTIRFASEDLLSKLLPVLDDFERSFKALGPAANDTGAASGPAQAKGDTDRKQDAFVGGIRLIHGKFRKILEQVGLKAFDSAGKPFDPGLHDALLQVPREDLPHHTVVEEIEKGYMLHEKVVRHARVIVSSQSGGPEEAEKKDRAPETGGGD